jgi:hypothetical protein
LAESAERLLLPVGRRCLGDGIGVALEGLEGGLADLWVAPEAQRAVDRELRGLVDLVISLVVDRVISRDLVGGDPAAAEVEVSSQRLSSHPATLGGRKSRWPASPHIQAQSAWMPRRRARSRPAI